MPQTTVPTAPTVPTWLGLRVRGAKARDFLQRMLSNHIADLGDDAARAVFLLEPTGRIVSGAVALADGDDIVLWCASLAWREAMQAGLEKYRIAEPVEFIPESEPLWLWLDPPAACLPATAFGVVRTSDGVGIRIPVTGLAEVAWWGRAPAGLAPVDANAVEAERIAAGVPAWDRELTNTTIPLEAGATWGLSHTKGCYVGQEVIERMWSRDRVARRLVSLTHVGGATATAPLALAAPAKGCITSVAEHPEFGRIALGYIAGEAGETVSDSAGGTWRVRQTPHASARITAASVAAAPDAAKGQAR